MNYCTNCGTKLEENAMFCHACGKKIYEENVTITTSNKPIGVHPAKEIFLSMIALVKRYPKRFLSGVGVIIVVIAIVFVYNATHCDYSSCNDSNAPGSRYCYQHKCELCNSSKGYDSNYCYYHKNLYSQRAEEEAASVSYDLKFSNIKIEHNSLYTVVTGTVTNNGSRSYKFVTIKGAFKNSSGTVIDTDSTYAVGSEGLASGESKTFRMSIDKNYNVTKCDISIVSYK